MMIMRTAAMTAVLVGLSVGVAGTASAETLDGTYTAEVFGNDGTPSPLTDSPWVLTSCGPDCVRAGARELHLQGNTWTASSDVDGDGIVCTTTIDNSSLTGTTGWGFMTFPLKLTKIG
jgi:hypothetical protein